ncbi:MAG: sterol-binding protein [Chitinivorax sp.]
MLNRLSVATLNHLLAQQPELPRRLQAMTGKVARLLLPPHDIRFVIGNDGLLSASEQEANATLSIPLSLVPRLLTHDQAALNDIHIGGESEFAAELGKVLMQLQWDAVEDLSRLVGDIAANRLSQIGQSLFGSPGQWLKNLSENLVEHWTEEQPLIAHKTQIQQFINDVDTLRDDAERLEKRLARLQALSSSHKT